MSEYWKDYRFYASLHKQSCGACSKKHTFHRVDLSPGWRVLGSLLETSLFKTGFGIRWMSALIWAGPSSWHCSTRSSRSSTCRLEEFWSSGCLGRWRAAPPSDRVLWCAEIFPQALGRNEHLVTNYHPLRSSAGEGNAEEPCTLLEEPVLLWLTACQKIY